MPETNKMTPATLLSEFKNFIRQENLFHPAENILLAVSGGIDSVVMADLFFKAELKFGIAHCNFQLRGDDSDADALFVKTLAENSGIAFYSQTFETITYKKENKLSLEEAARELRYKWLEEIRIVFNYSAIATAHHLNDSVETVLLNLTKGTGIKGLTGIPKKNGKIIRPLLFATREEIEQYANEHQIAFRTDSTNFENDFARNKIRNSIIPALKTINPSLEQTFQQTLHNIADTEIIYREQIINKLKKLVTAEGFQQSVSIAALLQLRACETYLFEFLYPFGFHADQIHQIMASLHHPGKVFYSATHRVIIDRKKLILCPVENETDSMQLIPAEKKTVRFAGRKLDLQINTYRKEMHFNPDGSIAYFDADKITYPLILRKWKKGDYFYPWGLTKKNSYKPGKKKISDLFNDLKYNLIEKENTWVLLSGDKIIWVVGVRQDSRLGVNASTANLLKIKMLP